MSRKHAVPLIAKVTTRGTAVFFEFVLLLVVVGGNGALVSG